MKNENEFKQHIISCYPQEGCGIINDQDIFIPCENIHDEPINNFMIDLEISKQFDGTKYKVIHSHCDSHYPNGFDPRTPSYNDMLSQEATEVPFGIVHCDGENVTDILWFGLEEIEPLLNREYISNVFDCYTLARDYYRLNFDFDFGLHPRPADWQSWNPHYMEMCYTNDFVELSTGTELLEGDILLYSIGSHLINHIGVFIKDDIYIHHLYQRKSCEDSVSKWHRQFKKALRHKNRIQ